MTCSLVHRWSRIAFRSVPAGAASSRTRPESRNSPHAARNINATTISEAIGSARANPVNTITTPARNVAMNPYRSVRMCWKAPSTFKLDRFAFANTHAATRFTTTPSKATTSTGAPATGGGSVSRRIASNATSAPTTSRVTPLTAADRISARFHPKVHTPLAGRAARRIAHSDAAIAPASVSMCPASESNTSDPETRATTTSTTMKVTINAKAMLRCRRSAPTETP